MDDDLIGLADRLEDAITCEKVAWFARVAVVRETGSTQDFARSFASGRPGIVVIAGRQTGGRGRLGRKWADTSHKGVAMTFVLDSRDLPVERLSLAAGVAACRVCEAALVGVPGVADPRRRVGIKWPNDVCERPAGIGEGPGRKLAGVLIEQTGVAAGAERGGLSLIGIGINVLQTREDWEEGLATRVASLAELGSTWGRAAVAERLMVELDRALRLSENELGEMWRQREMLIGRRGRFVSDGREYGGVVEAIDPGNCIVLRVESGEQVRLPALVTSVVRE
ncbi:MAG TPA: biotin--[acetyl-CoA-carboxylase] ligase [Phycisphaerales bacterium]|nr:biotin--[acetyl-CoA-carboxylase] ligase [Phycisphaerales bacterium]